MADPYVSLSSNGRTGGFDTDFGGQISRYLTQDDKNLFSINDAKLKSGVNGVLNKQPNDVYIQNPTQWGSSADYTTWNWSEVKLYMKPTGISISDIDLKDGQIATRDFINDTGAPIAEWNVGFMEQVQNTATSTWSNTTEVGIEQTIGFDVGFFSSSTKLTFSQTWQKGGSQSQETQIGSTESIILRDVPVNARKRVAHFGLIGTAKATVTYDVYLDGLVFCNYGDAYQAPNTDKKHHFYGVWIGDVLAKNGVTNLKTVTQTINLSYFSYSETKVSDIAPEDGSESAADIRAVNPALFFPGDRDSA